MAYKYKSLSKGGIYYLIYNVLNLAFPLVSGIYVSRILLPEKIGEVAAAQNLAQYFVILAFLGIPTYGMREISKSRDNLDERSKLFSELYVINFVSTCIFLICYLCVIVIIPAYRSSIMLYLIVGISIALNAFNISWLYDGLEEFKFTSIRNVVFKAFVFALLILFVRKPSDSYFYAGITVIGTAGNYIVNMVCAHRYVNFTFSNLQIKRHMKSILYLVAVNLAIELYSLVDVTMMNFLCSKESIAFYKYGHSINIMLLQVVNTFTMVLIPRISYYYKNNLIEEFNKLVSKALKLIIICSVPMIVGIQFTSDFLLVKMYGLAFVNSATVLKMLSILLLVSPVGYLLGSRMLLATNHENQMIISVGIGALFNVIGNAFLIPLYNEFGASLASIISEFIVMSVYILLGKKYYKLQGVLNCIFKVFVAAIVIAIYLFICSKLLLNSWVILCIQVFGAVILYFSILYLIKEEIVVQYCNIVLKKIKHCI